MEERKKLVLSDREAQKSSKTTVKNDDIEKIKRKSKSIFFSTAEVDKYRIDEKKSFIEKHHLK